MRRVGGRGADSLHELSYHWRYDNAIVGGLGPGGRRRIATVPFQTEGPTIVCRRSMTAMLEQIRVGWNRRRRSTDTVNLLYPFEVDRIHVVRSRIGRAHACTPVTNAQHECRFLLAQKKTKQNNKRT